ncbi:ABC transporter family protein [Clostridium argentinense CDC 2741]|uniref:ABC transporter family protein n=1 Tax=Clostridium argentinense CDC 2741 TaxID=1418104 RepID=A0A0C1TZE3_9CLOT|nr:ABC transporter ATP-binding protein [Clostridium argentinense]ARC83995.1 hypothetical protein RSJ17_05355 [Clostridium argentinense]KIE44653.1 ABC transporter family protein [Clostridium argentinense CDC 2741]NFF39400.1 ABC transporter ATP-binding protein [Clostridium argentinense]NFP50395.1 ABC transporter ATP-binding protein [Clostridium argentinense]NFP73381.1 ABC transporter ATP-binding protein [Clostridium argentinense]
MLELININKSYGNHKVLHNINLKLNCGEIFGFLGLNGAGKTSTIKIITGILNADSGDVLLKGNYIKKDSIQYKKKLGYVPCESDVFLRLTGIEYLNFIADMYEVPLETRQERILQLTNKFEINNVLTDKIKTFSHGMRKKLIMIGSLLHSPNLWILDEPMIGLDAKSSFELKKIMRDYANKGNTVFFSTHVLEVAENICDRVAIINDGLILFCGTIPEMRNHFNEYKSLEKMFLEMTSK